jgi:DNA-binding HxlR family transcriptional regulator
MIPKTAENCPGQGETPCIKHLLPVRDALDILGGKWKIPVIIALTFGNKRFKVIQREIPGITARMLSKELKELEINELVSRTVYDTSPVMVEYALTPYGRTLRKVITELHSWGSLHRKRITSSVRKKVGPSTK